jgi:hypothetical protein
LAKAVSFCNEEGVLIVAAAGNDACRCLHVIVTGAISIKTKASSLQGKTS